MQLPDSIAAALMRHLAPIFDDPEIINPIVEEHVRRLISTGEVVPRERLQVGGQVELCPIGLEQAARSVLEAGTDVEVPDQLRDAFKALAAVFDPVVEEPELPEPEPEPALDGDVGLTCKNCDEPVDREQALLSNTVCGQVLCRPCHMAKVEQRQKGTRQ